MEWRNLNFGEKLLHFLLPLSALFAFGALYLTSSCRSMLGIYSLGVVITMFIAVPDWPYFYRNPLSWHQPLGVDGLTTPTPRQASMPRLQLHMKMSPTNQIGTSSHEYFLTSHSIWGVRAETILPGSSAGCLNHPRLEAYIHGHPFYDVSCFIPSFVSMVPEAHEDLVSAWTLMMLLASSNYQLMTHRCRHYSWEPDREQNVPLSCVDCCLHGEQSSIVLIMITCQASSLFAEI